MDSDGSYDEVEVEDNDSSFADEHEGGVDSAEEASGDGDESEDEETDNTETYIEEVHLRPGDAELEDAIDDDGCVLVEAFKNRHSLFSVVLPDRVKEIKSYAFSTCMASDE